MRKNDVIKCSKNKINSIIIIITEINENLLN